ncbi:hypothetical protein OAS39_05090, partial [Pirellulales bacterium]|nr:hypothetical protein [Pirellulales bacterium]
TWDWSRKIASPPVLENLVNDVLVEHRGHLSTGIAGTNALEQALPRVSRAAPYVRLPVPHRAQ